MFNGIFEDDNIKSMLELAEEIHVVDIFSDRAAAVRLST